MSVQIDEIAEIVRLHSRSLVRELDLLKGDYLESGCTFKQCHALYELDQSPPPTLLELAESLLIDKSNASRLVKKLEQSGLVKAKQDAKDRRQKRLTLSSKGKRVLNHVLSLAHQQTLSALEFLDESQQQQIIEGMRTYSKALKKSRLQKGFVIRPIRRKDNSQVAATIRSVMTEFGAVGEGFSIVDPEVDRMYENYQTNGSCYFVIEQEKKIVGCGGLAALVGGKKYTCELRKMFYLPHARGRGLGKKLLHTLLDKAREFKYRECYIETLTCMEQAVGLYINCGFKEINKPMGNTGHTRCDRWFLRKL